MAACLPAPSSRSIAALNPHLPISTEYRLPKIIGYRDLATLLIAIERDHHRRHTAHIPTKEAAIVVVVA